MADRSTRVASLAHQLLRELLDPLPLVEQAAVVGRVLGLVEQEVAHEQRRCADLCAERSELWQATAGAGPGAPEAAREEARCRSNEARVLADLIGKPPEGSDDADA